MLKYKFVNKWALWLTIVVLLGAAGVLTACEPTETPTPCPTVEIPDCPDCPPEVTCPEPPEPVVAEVPYEALWAASPHNDAEAEAFVHWDEDDPPEVPDRCAKCHSTPGYLDFLGVDGTAAGTVDNAAALGSTVECVACHNEATAVMDSVVFPSGVEIADLGDEARCMQCHQGRASTVSVNTAIEEAGVDDDTVSEDLGFINIHYFAAAATRWGGMAMGGYQYEGKTYDAKFAHVDGIDTCITCHDPHTLEVKVDTCVACHDGVTNAEDLKNTRLLGSTTDYDGDGDATEGIYYEIEGLQEILYGAIQAYGEAAGASIVYDAHAYPYWFTDAEEGYASWTPRLLKAAYNYQTSFKDPGGYAHGGKYIIQLLYDSIEDLDADLAAGLTRSDAGHFDGSTEAWRHWDEDGEVSSRCSKCHTAEGLPTFLEIGTSVAQSVSNGMLCTTCHSDLATFSRYEVGAVTFPSGARLDTGNPDSNLCLSCHQGRESGASVDEDIADVAADIAAAVAAGEEVEVTELTDDTSSEDLGFINVHYFAAGATLFGTEAAGAYEYAGKTYVGQFAHVESFSTCTQCHDAHALTLDEEACGTCHSGIESVTDIRMDDTDYDGDGDTEEGIAGEIDTMREILYAEIQAYAADTVGTPIVYNSARYPYWFTEDGEGYDAWTPRMLKAAYNYQYAAKDPGAFAHNSKYILQVLYDSIADMGGDTTGMVRPEVESE